MIRTLLFVALPLIVAAETPGPHLSAPVLGYIFDGSGNSIRQILGVPGAASLDQAVAAGAALEAAWIQSSARVAVAVTKSGEIALVNWSGTPNLTLLESSLSRPTAAAFGTDRVAITDGTSVEVWSLAQPSKIATAAPDGGVSALAVRADGAVAVATGTGSILLNNEGDSQTIAAGGTWSALGFAGNDLLAADASELVRIDANGGRTVVAGVSGPAKALAVAKDGSRVAVALAEDLLLVDLSGAATPVACGCSAKGLGALEGNLVVHLAGATGAVRVLDADSSEPRVLEIHE